MFGVWTLFNALTGVMSKRNYTANDNRANLFFMISCDIQLLVGLILYFNSAWFDLLKSNAKVVMQNDVPRFFAVEHVTMMVIAWLLVHVGRSMVKRSGTDALKHRRSLIYFGVALVIIFIMIPWPFRQPGIARQLFHPF